MARGFVDFVAITVYLYIFAFGAFRNMMEYVEVKTSEGNSSCLRRTDFLGKSQRQGSLRESLESQLPEEVELPESRGPSGLLHVTWQPISDEQIAKGAENTGMDGGEKAGKRRCRRRCMSTCMCMCIRISMCTGACVCACICVCTCTCTCICICRCTCISICICECIYI